MTTRIWKIAAVAIALAFVSTAVVKSDPPAGKKEHPRSKATNPEGENKDESKGPEIGKPAPDFTLKNYDGKEYKLADLKDKVVVLEWYNIGCPVCKAYTERMKEWSEAYAKKGVVWIAIDSTNYGDNAKNAEYAKAHKLAYPILDDFSGKVGVAYAAKTTPHMYVINKGVLVYNGAIDDTKGRGETKKNYVADALENILAGKPVEVATTKPFGCSVKYK